MATAASTLSFQGLSSGVQTDALVSAILAQDGQGLTALQARQTTNTNKITALTAMKTSMSALYLSLATVQDQLNTRTVTSTDSSNSYVTAIASGASAGNYDVSVKTVATKGRISPTLDASGNPTNLAVADPTAAIFTGGNGNASFALEGTDGVLKTIQVSDNSLNGLRDAINASGAGVSASIINTGSGANPYQLVIAAKTTGTGTTSGVVSFAAIANADGSVASVNSGLGITSGAISGTFATPTALTGGLTSDQSGATAVDSVFTLNGIQLTRKTNSVMDAADGVTFNLLQGGETGNTTLTVAQNLTSATTGMQDVITKYNALLTGYNTASTSSKNADGSINQGPLSGDPTSQAMMTQIRAALTGTSAGLLAAGATYSSLGSVGVRTNSDGTLSLSTSAFQAALTKDPTSVMNLFTLSGGSTTGTGTIKGPCQTASDLLATLSSSSSGMLATDLKNIQANNSALAIQISQGQSQLDRQKTVLQKQFSDMEVTVAMLKASASSLTGS